MARITVEDCLEHVNNRFDLVLKASKRARKLAIAGVDPMLEWENDKPTVMALREIAAGYKFTESEESAISNRGFLAPANSSAVNLADNDDKVEDKPDESALHSSSIARTIVSEDLGDEALDLSLPNDPAKVDPEEF